ncbi:hypothetical protein [Cognatiluteimonas profundi]|uniref:hypothetical protein n=1 Tax=Cognatiluteimonas profundi TaxID=2594501 RepID=UPI00131AF461|nr:hypothetical protein [Lysobacter profundi]
MPHKDDEHWLGKMDFAPGMPVDISQLPTLHYQAIEGRVFTLLRFPNESVAHGEVPLSQLEDLVGAPIEEGWYSASGAYLGAELPGSLY